MPTLHTVASPLWPSIVPGYTGYRVHGSHPTVKGESSAPRPHAPAYAAYDGSGRPMVMPVVGYSGHLRHTHESHVSYGTSHWKGAGTVIPRTPSPPGRRGIGPFSGSPPARLTPEEEQAERDADEANEILQLRSMGIRSALKNALPSKLGGDPTRLM